MSAPAIPKIIIGRSQSAPWIPPDGNIACGNSIRIRVETAEAMKAARIASVTTQACGWSVVDSCCARPRLRPSVDSWAANSMTITA